jgi:hypothetical protein
MVVTVTDFERITGISRHTAYSWIYRSKFPAGIELAPTLGTTKMLRVTKESEYFKKITKELV